MGVPSRDVCPNSRSWVWARTISRCSRSRVGAQQNHPYGSDKRSCILVVPIAAQAYHICLMASCPPPPPPPLRDVRGKFLKHLKESWTESKSLSDPCQMLLPQMWTSPNCTKHHWTTIPQWSTTKSIWPQSLVAFDSNRERCDLGLRGIKQMCKKTIFCN